MDFDYSPRQKEWMTRVGHFMDAHVYAAEPVYAEQMNAARAKGDPWIVVPVVYTPFAFEAVTFVTVGGVVS